MLIPDRDRPGSIETNCSSEDSAAPPSAWLEGGLYIQGIGTAVPPRALTQEDAAAYLGTSCTSARTVRLLRHLVRLSGIAKRHLAVLDLQQSGDPERAVYRTPDQQPRGPGMAVRMEAFEACAAPLVLEALASFSPEVLEQVQQLITVSCTHASAPGLEQPILLQTAVPRDAQRWNLGFMGCSAALAALRLVERQGAAAAASLIVACELSSLHFQYTEQLDQMTANVLFADGAVALLVGPRPGPVRVLGCACAALPESAGQMLWKAGDHGLRLALSPELADTLASVLPEVLDGFLARAGLRRADVAHWLVHPGGPQILDAVETALQLGPGALDGSRAVLREYGNMSSPTIMFILKRLLAAGGSGRAVLLAFGPGLTIELALVHLAARHDSPGGFGHNAGESAGTAREQREQGDMR